ncbi:MAG TPA: CocE/NonD family hydrolase [Nevskia sp.]|nr:CocE/NonD family hydrolase [Nevskia sp.]
MKRSKGPAALRAARHCMVLPLAAAGILAAGCGSSTPPADNALAAARWTTLGDRAHAAAAAAPILSNGGARWSDYNPAAPYPNQNTTTVAITLPDGTRLSADVTLPADAAGSSVSQPLPTVVSLTGYDKNLPGNSVVNSYLGHHGYAQVIVDVRGTGGSQGQWNMFGATEQADYVAILDWIAAQPFCNGSIGMYGESLLGITSALAAATRHPAVKATFLIVPMADAYRDIVFTGGETNAAFIPAWFMLVMAGTVLNPDAVTDPATGVPLDLSQLFTAVTADEVPLLLGAILGDSNEVYDNDFWSIRSPREHAGDIRVPTFVVGGLDDVFQRGEPLLYEAVKRNAPSKLLIGPWTHIAAGSNLPADGVPPLSHIALQWFDQYLRGQDSGAGAQPNVTQYVYGFGHYVTASDWPHPRAAAQRLYLHGDRSLAPAMPGAAEPGNTTLQEPLNGLCSATTVQWTAGILGYLQLPCFADDTVVEAGAVNYQTAPMAQDFYLNGPIEADLWVSTTASDASLSVRLDDVDGSTVTPLSSGLQLLSMRAVDAGRSRTLDGQMIQPWHPYTQAALQDVAANTPTAVAVEVFPTSALIKAGHQLRVSIGPSDFPHGLPPLPALASGAAGLLTVHSDAQHPSSVVLPAVPVSALH